MVNRFVAALLILSGSLSLSKGLETSLDAGQCDPNLIRPARCIAAHEEPPINQPYLATCEISGGMTNCVPTSQSICGGEHGLGWAVEGRCEDYIDLSNPTECTEDYALKAILTHTWYSRCDYTAEGCSCEFYIDPEKPTVYIPTCDCLEDLYQP